MAAKRVIEGVHVIPMGRANAFLIEGDDGLTLIDAGFPAKEATLFEAVAVSAIRWINSSILFSLTIIVITSAALLRSCGRPVRGPTCTPSIFLWPRAGVHFGL